MQIATRCLGCSKVIRFFGTFTVRLTDRLTNPMTGKVKEVKVVGRLCRPCASAAGYKVKNSVR